MVFRVQTKKYEVVLKTISKYRTHMTYHMHNIRFPPIYYISSRLILFLVSSFDDDVDDAQFFAGVASDVDIHHFTLDQFLCILYSKFESSIFFNLFYFYFRIRQYILQSTIQSFDALRFVCERLSYIMIYLLHANTLQLPLTLTNLIC